MEAVKKVILFWFSGTGNSKLIASWFSELAVQKGIDCQTYDIDKTDVHLLAAIPDDTLIGFISPVHGFNFPQKALNFIRHFPKSRNRFFLMNTRGAARIGKWVTPGLTGIAFFVSSFWLIRKGYTIVGWIPFDMPSNWISIHPALGKRSSTFIRDKMNLKVKKHAVKIFSGGTDFLACRDLVQDILIFPVSLAYYLGGRFFFAKSFYASPACNLCGLCIRECPVQAIRKIDGWPYWTFKCESCMRCMNSCPQKAIETAHGLLAFLGIISAILTGLIYAFFIRNIQSGWLKFILFNVVFIILLVIFYRIQHILFKNKFIAKLISYTSLTHYKFWGRFYETSSQKP